MKYLSRSIIKEIESHFYNWRSEREELDRLSSQMARGFSLPQNIGLSAEYCAVIPSETGILEMERHIEYLQRWIALVDTVHSKLANTPQLSFITMIYMEKMNEVQVCERLFIERRTFYNWKSDILGYAAMKACEMGLISV